MHKASIPHCTDVPSHYTKARKRFVNEEQNCPYACNYL